jgi:alcohol dehydrogenase class IV
MSHISQFRFPTDIRFGKGARAHLSVLKEKYKVGKPLLVTDPGLVRTEAFQSIKDRLTAVWKGEFAEFSDVHANPSEKDVEAAWMAYAENGCDGVIGLGGGSALDVAKAMRLKVAFPDLELPAIPLDDLPERMAPFCAIPTTAGTGSEVGRSSVITISSLKRKEIFGADPLLADIALLDPELTAGLPPQLTASTGMDAMTHAIESFVCPVFHPMCDAIALEAIRLVKVFLPRAYRDGNDLEARGMMQVAASMGAVAFQKDLGAAHSLAHALSTEYGVQHGLANAIVLPEVIRFNGEQRSALYSRVETAMGLPESRDPASQTADFLEQFNKSIGITQTLKDLGIPDEALRTLAEKAYEDPCHLTNPRKCTEADLLSIYRKTY